jgi:hypothetical protein
MIGVSWSTVNDSQLANGPLKNNKGALPSSAPKLFI